MTLPDMPGGTSLDFSVLDDAFGVSATGEIPARAGLNQPAVEDILKGQMQDSPGWHGATDAAYGGLVPGVPFTPNVFMNLGNAITGLPLGTWPGTGPGGYQDEVTNVLSDVGNFFTNLSAMFGVDVDFNNLAFDVGEAANAFINGVLVDPLGAIFGAFTDPTWLVDIFSDISVGQLNLGGTNLLFNPLFDDENSIPDDPSWEWDGTTTFAGSKSVKVTADGSVKELQANIIRVTAGQQIFASINTKWAGFTGSGSPIQLRLNTFTATPDGQWAPGVPVILESVPVSTNSGFIEIDGSYTAEAGVDGIALVCYVDSTATAGTAWFAKAFLAKIGLLPQAGVQDLTADLNNLIDSGQDTLDAIWTGIFGEVPLVGIVIDDIIDGLQNIPSGNVQGLDTTFQQIIDVLWAGFAKLFGFGGKSIFDVASQASDTVTIANTGLELAEWNNAIAMVRNNKPLMQGMDETEESNFLMSEMFSAGSDPLGVISATSASVPIAFWRAEQSARKGVISWFGKGFTDVTALYIDVYRFNYDTSEIELLHSSGNQIGQVTGSWKLCRYFMDVADRVDVVAGGAKTDVIAVAWRVEGTGTHSIGGKIAGSWLPDYGAVIPARPAATRTGVGDLAFGSVAYSGNVPWFGIGIAAGDTPPDFHAPRTTQIANAGPFVYDIPEWADFIDEIKIGGGGGGAGGDPVLFLAGAGGFAGSWDGRTLVRGVDFPADATELTGTIGSGGTAGPWPAGSGGDGTPTVRDAIPGGDIARSAAAGLGSTHFDNEGFGDIYGDSPGNFEYNGETYQGGGIANGGAPGQNGQAPGGGGGGGLGGTWGVAFMGGEGARGSAWFVARQA